MPIQLPPTTQDTPAIEMPLCAGARDLTALGGEAAYGEGYCETGDGPGVRWEVRVDLTAAPNPESVNADTVSNVAADGQQRDRRLRLLARKYGQRDFSREDQARLEILNQRLRRVIVRVSEDDVVGLEETAQQLEDSRNLRKQLEEKYGI